MKKLIKIVSLILCLVMLCAVTACSEPDTPDTGEGTFFSPFSTYTMDSSPTDTPKTFEVALNLDTDITERAGVLVGNYKGSEESLNFEIHERGNPRLYYVDKAGKSHSYKFRYNVCTSEWIHLCVTWDYKNLKLYANGELVEEAYLVIGEEPNITNPYVVGGDLRSGNTQYFKGKIRSVALFSDIRTADEIASDYRSFSKSSDNLMAYYKLSNTENQQTISDFSTNGFDLTLKSDWIEGITPPEDYEFSLMAIGDTQIITYDYPDKLKNIYDYVLGSVESKKVKHVFGLGDITDADKEREWETAYAQISRMDGVVPYSVIRGNHDIYSADRNLALHSHFDTYFGDEGSPYSNQYIDYYKGIDSAYRARNTVHEFSSDSRDYLVIALDFGANDDILAWAESVCQAHPNHNVIITTHAYLSNNGSYYDSTKSCPPTRDYGATANNGDDMWNKLISKNKNIVMVLCGHDPSANVLLRQSQGVNRNIVSEILVDPQGIDESLDAMGMVATLYISRDGKTVTVEYYSTVHNKFYKSDNHYSFQIATVDRV